MNRANGAMALMYCALAAAAFGAAPAVDGANTGTQHDRLDTVPSAAAARVRVSTRRLGGHGAHRNLTTSVDMAAVALGPVLNGAGAGAGAGSSCQGGLALLLLERFPSGVFVDLDR